MRGFLGLAVPLVVAGCASGGSVFGGAGVDRVGFGIVDLGGETVGIAQIVEGPGSVFIEAEFTGVPEGLHGFHIHEVGDCMPPFDRAGAHFNPTGRAHGRDDPGGAHVGDLPNIYIPPSGLLTVSVVVEEATLAAGRAASLADADGAALVVHAGGDDYASQPDGDTGERIACGVIFPVAATDEDEAR